MANFFKKMLGIVHVQQKGDTIQIGGIATQTLHRDIETTWGTSKINKFMFKNFGTRFIEFDLFFALEVHYMLQTLLKNKRNWTSKSAIQSAIKQLEENTWLAQITAPQPVGEKLDRSKLGMFHKTPLPHQSEFFEQYEIGTSRLGLNGFLLAAGAGSGKAQPLYSKILTPSGWSTMGEMTVGSQVIAHDGSISNVVGVFPQGEKEIFEITFKDGRTVECCAEHLWRVYNNRTEPSKPGYCQVVNTAEIIDRLNKGKRVHIDLYQPQEGEKVELPLDPYLLGVLLGDGAMSHKSVSITKNDTELFDAVRHGLPEGVELRERANQYRATSFGITRLDRTKPNPVVVKLMELGLHGTCSHEKFIPEVFFTGSLTQRLELLRGILDTDGTVSHGSISFCSTSEQLALDVQKLVWSVGGIASISVKQSYYNYFGERRAGRLAYNVNIRVCNGKDVFKLSRKKDLALESSQYSETLKLAITQVRSVGKEQAQCIQIDHPDHLYVTDGYVVTHNTLMDLMIAEMVHSDYVIVISPKNAIDRVWVETLTKEYKKPQEYWLPASGQPYKGQRVLLAHYEALEKLIPEAKRLNGKVTVVLDESHNFNELKSQRTNLFLELCKQTKSENIIWASGTPIKALGGESIPLLRSIDPLFTPDVEERFKKIFGVNAKRALDILRNRMGFINYRVEKSDVVDNKPTEIRIDVKIPNGREYTLEAMRDKMTKYIAERTEYYKKNYKQYEDVYERCLKLFESQMTAMDKEQYTLYKKCVQIVKETPDPRYTGDQMKFANRYEKERIMPKLSNADRKLFVGAKSVIKYVNLKVMGEALGNVLGKARTALHVEMIKQVNFTEIMKAAEKKTVIFTSYVEVVKECDRVLRQAGMEPMLVYGATNKSLASNVGAFDKDPNVNPLVATFPSLSTAVPLVMADQEIFLNVPFRDHELVQAKARIDRLGQDTPVKYVYVYLDTGKEPNISTRSKDILEWSREQVRSIMGVDYNGDADEVLNGYVASLESDQLPQDVRDFEYSMESIMERDGF